MGSSDEFQSKERNKTETKKTYSKDDIIVVEHVRRRLRTVPQK